MKKLLSLCAVLLLSSACAYAVPFSVHITVDEQGHGTFTNTAGFSATLTGVLLTDPGPGGEPLALTYDLLNPPGLTAGDVVLLEGDGRSDLIRFNSLGEIGGSLVFYSDRGDGVDAVADRAGFPDGLYANIIRLREVDLSKGGDGANYTPAQGQPGFVSGASGPVTYTIVSDPAPVPEPSSLALLSTGVLGAAGMIRRKYFA